MIDLGALKISIETGAEQAQKELTQVGEIAEKQQSKFSKFGSSLKKGALAGVGAVAGLTTALFGMATKSAGVTDEIDKLSQKIGMSREGFQEYSYILSQNGTDVEVLQRGFKTLTDRMDESVEGTGKGAEAFDKLGLSATDLNGELKSQEQMFEETSKALMGMPEGAEKSALAFELFGKAGQELMPLLNGTAEDMDDLRQAAHDMGLVLSDDAIDAGAQFTDTMDNIQRSLGAVVANVGAEVMPMFQNFLDWVMDHMPEIQEIIRVVFEKIGTFVKMVVDIFNDYLIPAFQLVLDWTKENWPAIQAIIDTVVDAIVEIVEGFIEIFKGIWELWGEDIKKVADNVFNAIKITVETVMGVIRGVIKTITSLIQGDWKGVWEGISQIFVSIWEGMKKLLPNLLDGIFNVMKLSFTVFKDIGKDMFGSIWDGMKDIWSSISSWVGEKVNWLTDKLTFWRKGSNEMEADSNPTSKPGPKGRGIDGSHARGLDFVPFDGYMAELHRGERILTADSTSQMDELLRVLYRYFTKGDSDPKKEINIQNLLNIEKNHMEDEVDERSLANELERALISIQ